MGVRRGAMASDRVGGYWRAMGILLGLVRRASRPGQRGDHRFTGARYAYPAISMEA